MAMGDHRALGDPRKSLRSLIVWVLSAAFWILAVVGLALTIFGGFLFVEARRPAGSASAANNPDFGRDYWSSASSFFVWKVTATGALVHDEAMRAGVPASFFEAAADHYFDGMDPGVKLSEAEIQGRNVWLVWTGGNDRFWDTIIGKAFGTFDLVKLFRRRPGWATAATIAGNISVSSTSPASTSRPSPTRIVSVCGSTSDAPTARLIRSRMKHIILALSWARGVVPACRSAHITVSQQVSSNCGCFPTRILMRRHAAVGTRNDTTTTQTIIAEGPGAALPRRHGMRVLSCRAEPNSPTE